MASTFTFRPFPLILSPRPNFPSLRPQFHRQYLPTIRILRPSIPSAIGPDGKFYPDPADDDPPEAPEDSGHGVSKFQQIYRQAARARKLQEEDFKKHQSTYLSAIADVEDAPENAEYLNSESSGDDLFGEIDKAIALKRKEFVKQGLLKPNPKKEKAIEKDDLEGIDELETEEVGLGGD